MDATVVNARTGEVVEFVSNEPDVLTMLVTWPVGDRRVAEHVHPGMEETWTVLDGRAAFEIDGVRIDAAAGSTVVAPRGRPHRAWNPGGTPTRLRIEMRPALRWEEFVRRHVAGGGVDLLAEFPDEIAPGRRRQLTRPTS